MKVIVLALIAAVLSQPVHAGWFSWGPDDLVTAAQAGDLAKVKKALGEGVDVNAKDHGRTALIMAGVGGHIGIVEHLLASGADAGAKDHYGNTALTESATRGHQDIVSLLLKKATWTANDKGAALFGAAKKGHAGIMRTLLAVISKADVKSWNAEDEGALLFEAAARHDSCRALFYTKRCALCSYGLDAHCYVLFICVSMIDYSLRKKVTWRA